MKNGQLPNWGVSKKTSRDIGDLILFGIYWLVGIGFLIDALRRPNLAPNNLFMVVLIVFLANYTHIFMHELGHILGGLLVGMKPYLFAVKRFALYRTASGWRIQLNANIGAAGGVAGSFLPNANTSRWREFIKIASAPFMDLFLGLLLAILVFTNTNHNPVQATWHGDLRFFLEVWAGFSLAAFSYIFSPREFDGYMNDGLRLKRLLQGGANVVQEIGLMNLFYTSFAGNRPKSWHETWVKAALSGTENNIFDLDAQILAYYHALDKNEIETARQHLTTALAHIDRFSWKTRCEIHLEAAYFYVRFDQDLESALKYFQLTIGYKEEASLIFRAEAAIRLLQGHTKETISKAQAALKALSLVRNIGVGIAEREWLETLLEEAKVKLLEHPETKEPTLEPLITVPESRRLFGYGAWIFFLIGLSLLQIQLPTTPEQYIFIGFFAPFMTNLFFSFAFVLPGWIFGFKSVSPSWLELFRKEEKGVIRMNQARASGLVGSWLKTGATNNQDLVRRSRFVLLGGLVVIGFTGVAALVLSQFLLSEASELPAMIEAIPHGVAAIGWYLMIYALGSLVSLTGFDLFYTGYRLDILRRGGLNAEREAAHSAWVAAVTRGERPRDWHPDWMETIMKGNIQTTNDFYDRVGVYFWALDRGDVALAEQNLEDVWQNLKQTAQKNDIGLEKSYFEAIHKQDAVTARQTLSKTGNFVTLKRAEAAVLFAEGDFSQAAKVARVGLNSIYQASSGGIATVEAEWLEQIEQRAQKAMLEQVAGLRTKIENLE